MTWSFVRGCALAGVVLGSAACSSSSPPATTNPVVDGGAQSPCGTCPTDYACGTANGLPVCRAPSGVPLFGNVVVVLMENTSRKTLEASSAAPYLKSLETTWATGADYHGVAHPSLPNYLALVSGDTYGVTCDCAPTGTACTASTCTLLAGNCGCGQSAPTIADQLETARLSWKSYAEDMGTPCNAASAGHYAVKHVPFLYFDALRSDTARCASHVVDFTNFATDLGLGDAAPGTPPAFSFVTPNLVNDMHDPSLPQTDANYANGDTWLSKHAQPIIDSALFKKSGLLVIVWDEDDLSGVTSPDDPIPIYVMSPFAKSGGYSSTVKADHYALLATIEDGLGLPRLGKADGAAPLADYFPDK